MLEDEGVTSMHELVHRAVRFLELLKNPSSFQEYGAIIRLPLRVLSALISSRRDRHL